MKGRLPEKSMSVLFLAESWIILDAVSFKPPVWLPVQDIYAGSDYNVAARRLEFPADSISTACSGPILISMVQVRDVIRSDTTGFGSLLG